VHGAPASASWRRFVAFAGPGAVVAVGYIDPGNWATDVAAGARYGYALLWVVLASSLVATLLQATSARLGIATGLDLAQACRAAYPRLAVPMWLAAEVAVVATDVAEVLGSALALKLLFGLPLRFGVVLTAADVLLLLGAERRSARTLERLIVGLVLLVAASFVFEIALSRPALGEVLRGYVPGAASLRDPKMLYLAVGILGATVMPHNLYLHSSLVKARAGGLCESDAAKRHAIGHATVDTVVSLGGAMMLNSALLVLAAAVFHRASHFDVAELQDAHRLLAPLLGPAAAAVFAFALLAAGQSATMTGTMAGQIIMAGYLRLRCRPWQRRLVTRALAVVPALGVVVAAGEGSAGRLLVGSQVVLSLQLPLAIVPLLRLTANRGLMGPHVSPRWTTRLGWAGAAVIVAANAALLYELSTSAAWGSL
jgi:manganese transport protein